MTSTPATPAPRPLAGGGVEELREVIAGNLLTARERTRLLTESVDDTDLVRQHSPLMSPLVWDLAHIANQEELWLLRNVGGREPMHPEIDPLYDAFEHPRAARPTLPLLPPAEARAYAREVRGRVMDLLESARFSGAPLVTDGFAYGMVAQHEQQHDETMLITHQLRRGAAALTAAPPGPPPPDARRLPGEVLVAGGAVHHGHLHRAVVPGQRAARAPGRRALLLPGHRAGEQRRLPGVHRRRRVRRPALVDPGGLGSPAAGRPDRAAVLAPRCGRLDPRPVRGHRAGAARRAGDARVLVRGGCLRPLGRAAAADRGGVGEGGPVRPGHRAVPAVPLGRRGPVRGPGQPGPAVPPARARGQLSRGRRAVLVRGSSSGTCGSGRAATSCPTRASAPGRTASTPRSSSGPSTR